MLSSKMTSLQCSQNMLLVTRASQFSPNNKRMQEQEAVKDASGPWLSLGRVWSVLVVHAILKSIANAAAMQRAAPCKRTQLARVLARPLLCIINCLARYLWNVRDIGRLTGKRCAVRVSTGHFRKPGLHHVRDRSHEIKFAKSYAINSWNSVFQY